MKIYKYNLFIWIVFPILFNSCAVTKFSTFYTNPSRAVKSGDTVICNWKASWGDFKVYFWPFKKVTDSMVLFSNNYINPWLGYSSGSRDGWCIIDSITSNSSKILILETDKHKISSKIGIIPDSGKDTTNLFTYSGSRIFKNQLTIFKDSISFSEDYQKEIMKRQIGFPSEFIIGGLLGLIIIGGLYPWFYIY